MVSAREALRSAIRDGILERKRRAGYWTKRQFVLTSTHLMHFESMEAKEPVNSFATMEIMAVQKSLSDPHQRVFTLVLFRKKKEYRAKTTEERDLWMAALESVSGMKGTGAAVAPVKNQESLLPDKEAETIEKKDVESADNKESKQPVQELQNVDILALCEQMKRSFTRQIQISRSFSSKDVVEFVKKTFPHLSMAQIQDIGQQMIDDEMIVPQKSHVFSISEPGRFKFAEYVNPKVAKNLAANNQFNARKYAENFLRKQPTQASDSDRKKRSTRKENTGEDVKEDINVDYTAFIRAADDIKTIENSVSQLKTQVVECRRKMGSLKSAALEVPFEKGAQLDFNAIDTIAEKRKQSMAMDEFIRDLEVYLFERNYEEFTHLMLEYNRTQTEGNKSATETQQSQIDELRQQFIEKLVDEFNTSLQTSERIHKKANHLEFLIQLGEAQLATNMCLQNYSVRIALQLRHVPSHGNALNYVINFSRTFFSSLLVCYEDFEHSFRGQKSSHFISLTVWISAQLEHFANELTYHIFPDNPNASHSRDPSAVASSPSCVAIDVSEFKSIAKYVSNALRFVFYGSRQLELSGLPTAHSLAPHLARGLISFLSSYCVAIKNTMREEIKRERWEMVKRTIRDPENQLEQEIVLTQSARLFYTLVQQFLRDVQRVLNPSCATSYLPEVHEVIVSEADEVLVRYIFEALQYLESPKLSSSLRPKHIVGILTNAAYIQDDCTTRCTNILKEYLPQAVFQDRTVEVQLPALWDKLMAVGIKRCAQSLMKMSFNWQDLDLAEENLVDMSGSSESATSFSLFAGVIVKELSDTLVNNQLNKAVKNRVLAPGIEASLNGAEHGLEKPSFPVLVLVQLLQEMLDDELWWQGFSRTKGTASRQLGYGGLNRFLAELDVLQAMFPLEKEMEALIRKLDVKMVDMYQQLYPGKKDIRANAEWIQSYKKQCTGTATQ